MPDIRTSVDGNIAEVAEKKLLFIDEKRGNLSVSPSGGAGGL